LQSPRSEAGADRREDMNALIDKLCGLTLTHLSGTAARCSSLIMVRRMIEAVVHQVRREIAENCVKMADERGEPPLRERACTMNSSFGRWHCAVPYYPKAQHPFRTIVFRARNEAEYLSMNNALETAQIPAEITKKWQDIIDLLAEALHVPSALIMKVEPPNIRVFIRSDSEGNPYERDELACLDTGLYCETVMKSRQILLVPDALADQEWNENPDIKLGMISYMGFPVAWPNGDIFGTICVLDAKPNEYSELYRKILFQCREVLQTDLKLLQASIELELKVLERTAELRKSGELLQKAQTALAHATRVTTLGELTSSLAHEVSQPLGAMSLNATAALCFLDVENPDLGEARDALRAVIMDGERANHVLGRVRALTKINDVQKMPLDINDVIKDVMLIFRQEALSHGVSLLQELASELPQVLGDRIQLQQVIMNLLMNGIQAMSGVTGRGYELRVRSQEYGPDHILVAVEDTGTGIDPQNADRLFSAFFTTKPDGLGLGLSICQSIVEQHGGKIWGISNSGVGSTFQFTLPARREGH
jgi:signal transduction histidine kinase